LTTETTGNVHELDESYDCRFGQRQAFTSNVVAAVRLDDLGFAFDDQTKSAPYRHHSERLERGVQRQTPHGHSPECNQWKMHETQPATPGG
jgi:hypothetical protein